MKKNKIFTLIILFIPLFIYSQNDEIIFPIKHLSTLASLKYSPNKKYIVTGSNDWTLKLWYASSGSLMRTFKGHSGTVNCFDFSENGNYLASCSNDSTVIIWDISTGSRNKEVINLGGKVTSIAFNHNENIVAGTNNGKLVVINVNTKKTDYSFTFSQSIITHVGFTKEKNKLLVSTSAQAEENNITTDTKSPGSLFLFDFFNFNKPIAISNYKENIIDFCFSNDSEKIVTSANNGMVRVWKTKNYLEEIAFKNTNLSPGKVFISKNSKMIGVASQKTNKINLWRISGEKLFDFTIEKGKVIYGEFNEDFTRIHICNDFGMFQIYDLDARARDEIGQYIQSESSLSSFALSKTSTQIAMGFGNGLLRGFNVTTSLPFKLATLQSSKIVDLAFTTDEKKLCVSNDQTVIYYDNSERTEPGDAFVTMVETATGIIKKIITYKNEYVTSLNTFANNCIAGLNSGNGKLYEINNGKEINFTHFHDYDITDFSFTTDNKWLLTSSIDATIKIWKIEGNTFTQTNTFEFNNEVTNVISTINNQIIFASVKGTGLILIKDLNKENQLIINEKIEITDIDISEKDSLVFSAINCNQTQCFAYSYAMNKELWNTKEVGSKIIKLTFSDKYNVLFCALENGTIVILNATTGKKICTIVFYKNYEWLIYTPENYFDASSGILPNINIINKLTFINHEEIEKYHQKGILAKILLQ